MAQRYVYGVYSTYTDAQQEMNQLVERGVPRNSISLVGSEDISSNNDIDYDFIKEAKEHDNRNWFQKVFGFAEDDPMFDDVDTNQYETSLQEDKILIVVDQDYKSVAQGGNTSIGRDSNTDILSGSKDDSQPNPKTDETPHIPLVDQAGDNDPYLSDSFDAELNTNQSNHDRDLL